MKTLKLAGILLVVASLAGVALAQPPAPEIEGAETVAGGFNGPQGVLVDPEGTLWVIDSGLAGDQELGMLTGPDGETFTAMMGQTAQIVAVAPDGAQTVVAMLPSIAMMPDEVSGGARLALLDGVLYATSGGFIGGLDVERPPLAGAVVRVAEDGTVTEVANTWAFEAANNPDGFILESHPYGIAAGPDGWLYVAEAGANDLLRVNPETGDIELVAAFTAGFPGGFPNPNRGGAVEADPVPTGVSVADDGTVYVAFLTGAPFIPGTAKVMQVTPGGEVSDFATGLTTLVDLQRGPDGELYAVQFGVFGEQGPDPTTGAIIRVREGDASEVVVSGLPFPTAIAFDEAGNAYVTVNGVGAPGSGAVVRFNALTEMAGEPVMAGGESMGGEAALDGAELVDTRCTVCHTRERIDNASKDEAGWAATVDRMIGYGAQLNEAERDAVISYLAGQ